MKFNGTTINRLHLFVLFNGAIFPAFVSPHALLTYPSSLNHGNLAMASKDFDTTQHFTMASYGIIDKAFFDNDHSITPWQHPGEFDHDMARDLIPGHPQTLHPCGCNAGNLAHCAGIVEEVNDMSPVVTEWEIGSAQNTAWNAYANHGGGYVYSLCKREKFDECRSILPPDVYAATESEEQSYLDCVWSCFESNTLEYVPNSQRLMYRDNACTYVEINDLEKVGKDNHVWRTVPIPDTAQIANGKEGKCQWEYVSEFSNSIAHSKFIDSFGEDSTCDTGVDAHNPKDWNIVDQVKVPSWLEEGEYLLSWRWDAYTADQMWTSCAALNLVSKENRSDNGGNNPFDETGCNNIHDNDSVDHSNDDPPAPSDEGVDESDDEPPTECQDILPLPGNWGGTNSMYDCDFYQNHGGDAYCAHAVIKEACCFCGGGSGDPVLAPILSPVPVPVPSPVTVPTDPNVVGTCGGGNRGNGICHDQTMCCSQWGWCGTAATGHCDGSNPVPSPVAAPVSSPVDSSSIAQNTPPPPSDGHGNESRLIAYLGNWQACPTDEQMAQYTHIVIAFAVSYTWNQGKNICSETCEIATPPVCNNSPQPELIQKWKNAGKKVILSFGGAGMGGSWAGDPNDCWDYCFGREAQVVDRLTEIVNDMGLDGVDIDYEYFYEDNQNGSGFNKGVQAQKFLKDVTVGLRNSMPAGFELTHAPMETDMEPGRAYYELLKEISGTLDFLMPQYYNGYIYPFSNFDSALSHFTKLSDGLFSGDASKIVFGFCIGDCGTFNLDGHQSSIVMENLTETYPCNGGAFFWVVNDDTNGHWSKPVKEQLDVNRMICSNSQD